MRSDFFFKNVCFPTPYKVRSAAAEIYFASLIFFAVVPAERSLELNSKGKLTSLNIFKGL